MSYTDQCDELYDAIHDLMEYKDLGAQRYILAHSINEDSAFSCAEQLENAETFLKAGETFCVLTNKPVKPTHPLLKVMIKYANDHSGIIVMSDPEYVQKVGIPKDVDIIVQTVLGETELFTNTNGNPDNIQKIYAMGPDEVITRLKHVWKHEKQQGTPINSVQLIKKTEGNQDTR